MKNPFRRRRLIGAPEIIDLGDGFRAIVRKHPHRDGRGTTVQVINDNKDRTLAGKRRRDARKAARRAANA